MQLGIFLNKLISALSFSTEVWLSLLLGAAVTVAIAYIIYRIQKKESKIHKQEHDAKLDEIKLLHQQDSEKIKVLYELIIQSQRGSIGEIEAAVLEQKIEIAADNITEDDSDHAQALKAIAEKDKDEADDLLNKIAQREHDLAEVYELRAMNETRNGFYPEAVKWCRKIVELEPDNFDAVIGLIESLFRADLLQEVRELAQARLDALKKAGDKDEVKNMSFLEVIGQSYIQERKYEQAEPIVLQVLELKMNHYGENSRELSQVFNSLALLAWNKNEFKESEKYYLKSLSYIQPGLEKDDLATASINSNLSYLYQETGRYDEAIQLLENSIRIISNYLGEEHPELFFPLTALASVYYKLNRLDEAEAVLLRAQKTVSKLGESHQNYFLTLSNFAFLYSRQKKYSEAESCYRKMLEDYNSALYFDSQYKANIMVDLAYNQYLQDNLDEAEALNLQALQKYSKENLPESAQKVRAFNNLGLVRHAQQRYNEAVQDFHDAIQLLAKLGITNSPDLGVTRTNLARTYFKQDRWMEAESLLNEAFPLYPDTNTPLYLSALQDYADVMLKLGRQVEGNEYKAKAQNLKAKLEGQTTEHAD